MSLNNITLIVYLYMQETQNPKKVCINKFDYTYKLHTQEVSSFRLLHWKINSPIKIIRI